MCMCRSGLRSRSRALLPQVEPECELGLQPQTVGWTIQTTMFRIDCVVQAQIMEESAWEQEDPWTPLTPPNVKCKVLKGEE